MVPGRVRAERLAAASLIGGHVMRVVFRVFVVAALLGGVPMLAAQPAVARETQSPSPAPTVEVLDAGKAPQEQLRLSPAVGSSGGVAMTMTESIEQSGASRAKVNVPPIRATIAASLPDTTPNGDLHVTFSYPSFEVLKGNGSTAAARRQVERALEGVQGLAGEMTLTTQGVVVDSRLDIPTDADPSIAQILGQLGDQFRSLTVPLPEPAVGEGARWRATTELTLGAIQARNVYEYSLKKRDGTRLQFDIRGTQTAQPQSVALPGQQSGVDVRLTKFKTTFRGAVTLDLSRLLAGSGRIAGNGNQTFRVDAGRQKGTVRQHLDLEASIKPA